MTHASDTTRRGFLSTAAVLAASAVVTVPAAAALAGDPIFDAIDMHKAAKAAFYDCVSAHSKLESLLPRDQRQSNIDAHGESIVATDDPRWIESERDVMRLSDAETDAACVLVSIVPATMAGIIALLQYAVAADTDGVGWPADLQTGAADAGKAFSSRSWHQFLVANLSEVLPAMVSA